MLYLNENLCFAGSALCCMNLKPCQNSRISYSRFGLDWITWWHLSLNAKCTTFFSTDDTSIINRWNYTKCLPYFITPTSLIKSSLPGKSVKRQLRTGPEVPGMLSGHNEWRALALPESDCRVDVLHPLCLDWEAESFLCPTRVALRLFGEVCFGISIYKLCFFST